MTEAKGGRPTSYPGDETAIPLVIEIGRKGGGKAAMAEALQVSHKTLLTYLNPDDTAYKGEAFCKAVELGLTLGMNQLMQRVDRYSVEEPNEARLNMGAIKFLAQHKYGLTDKTQVETQNPFVIKIEGEDKDL